MKEHIKKLLLYVMKNEKYQSKGMKGLGSNTNNLRYQFHNHAEFPNILEIQINEEHRNFLFSNRYEVKIEYKLREATPFNEIESRNRHERRLEFQLQSENYNIMVDKYVEKDRWYHNKICSKSETHVIYDRDIEQSFKNVFKLIEKERQEKERQFELEETLRQLEREKVSKQAIDNFFKERTNG